MMDDSPFRSNVRGRRNRFFLWWIGWVPTGVAFLIVFDLVPGRPPSNRSIKVRHLGR